MKFTITTDNGICVEIKRNVLLAALAFSAAFPGQTIQVVAADKVRLEVLDGEVITDLNTESDSPDISRDLLFPGFGATVQQLMLHQYIHLLPGVPVLKHDDMWMMTRLDSAALEDKHKGEWWAEYASLDDRLSRASYERVFLLNDEPLDVAWED